jgi:alpha-glucan,water dikinase
LALGLKSSWRFGALEFALYDPKTMRWDNNGGRNYHVNLPESSEPRRTPGAVVHGLVDGEPLYQAVRELDEGYELAVDVRRVDGRLRVELVTDLDPPVALHWGLAARTRFDWQRPEPALWPAGTMVMDAAAVRTPFVDEHDLCRLRLDLPDGTARGLVFVLYQDSGHWWKDRGRNFFLPLQSGAGRGPFAASALNELATEIVEREVGAGSWSLMHRFDFACELLERIPPDSTDGLALLFVWLRFSALRQLDWQRNYNTKPRELAHAQDRLSGKVADRYAGSSSGRRLLRMISATLGRGGDGQRVRDGILEIMHRHHVKEVAGHFLEEWHQKLHNNTTPDDVAICEAYLAFLEHDGDGAAFDEVLRAHGLDRERLTRYERPIRSAPDFVPQLREALIADFRVFLSVLRSMHSATDLGAAMQAARPSLDDSGRQRLDRIWRHREDVQALSPLAELVTAARESLAARLQSGRSGLRDLLYLDLALEDFVRATAERSLQLSLGRDELVAWTELALRNLCLSCSTDELRLCLVHLQKLMSRPCADREWALHGQAVLERVRRELSALIDQDSRLLQPAADFLGAGFGAQPWTVQLFAEEVVRGRLEFAVAALARKLDTELRAVAGLGRWLVVSRGTGGAAGTVEVVSQLASVQGHRYDHPVLLVADEVAGTEEVPEGVRGVLTGSTVDLASHVAVRVRNAEVLLATCYDAQVLQELRSRAGEWVALRVSPSGDVETGLAEFSATRARPEPQHLPSVHRPNDYLVTVHDFCDGNVGGKSCNLQRLRGRLPSWIDLPPSAALPFGVCERVLDETVNREVRSRFDAKVTALHGAGEKDARVILGELRDVVAGLHAPPPLEAALRAGMGQAGVPFSVSWDEAWLAIKRVWASKWNERAWLNRRANGVRDDSLFMAVLIQEIVEAEYAFVIHTANPATGDRQELYAELVPGLGESLVGNHPGRALGFCQRRGEAVPRLMSFPSKSFAIRGGGLIFRSDSNGEDLAGFAGAGLHDSVMVPAERQERMDYTHEELLWNEERRNQLLGDVTRIGVAIEDLFGAPQDIEGAYARGRFTVLQARPQVGL